MNNSKNFTAIIELMENMAHKCQLYNGLNWVSHRFYVPHAS